MVGAKQLLPVRDVADLERRGAAALDQEPGLDTALAADQAGDLGAGRIVADD